MKQDALFFLSVVSGAAFLFFGAACLLSPKMVAEFERYHLSPFRKLVGILEILGGLGVLLGLWWEPLRIFSATGLATLMLMGVGVRLRLRDSVIQTLPAALLLVINSLIVWLCLSQ